MSHSEENLILLDSLNEQVNSSLLELKVTENLIKKTPKHIQGDCVTLTFTVKASDISCTDSTIVHNPYFIFDIFDTTQEETSYISEVSHNSLSPSWKSFQVKFRGNIQEINNIKCRFILWNWAEDKDHEQIGECDAPISDLLQEKSFSLYNRQKKRTDKNYKGSGTLFVQGSATEKEEEIVNPVWKEMNVTVYQLTQQIKKLKKEIEEKEILKV